MIPAARSVVLAEELIRIRLRLAPPGTLRERFLRALYLPVVDLLTKSAMRRALGDNPEPRVVFHSGPGAEAGGPMPVDRILILKLDHLGDFVLALPALGQLREAFPAASITLVCGSWNSTWAEQCGLFDDVAGFDFFTPTNGEWRGAGPAQFAAFKELDLGSFDLAIDLRHDPDTRALLAQVDAKFRAGFCAPAEAGGSCLDIALPDLEHVSVERGTGRSVHAQLRLQLLASAVVATLRPVPDPAACLVKPQGACGTGERPYAILAPGAGSPIRVWPIERFAALGRILCQRHGMDIVITGGRYELEAGQMLADALPAGQIRNLAGRLPLGDLPGVIRRASLYVGLDAGTTHLAAALGVPTVAITSGVPNLAVWHAVGRHVRVVAGQTACSPCYLAHAAQCPFGVACLNAITVDHVMVSCEALLSTRHAPCCCMKQDEA